MGNSYLVSFVVKFWPMGSGKNEKVKQYQPPNLSVWTIWLDYFVRLCVSVFMFFWMALNIYIIGKVLLDPKISSYLDGVKSISSDWKTLSFLIAPFLFHPLRLLIEKVAKFPGVDMEEPQTAQQEENEDPSEESADYVGDTTLQLSSRKRKAR